MNGSLVSQKTGSIHLGAIAPNKPILGESVFRHESGIHCAGLQKDQLAYQPFDPERVGQQTSIVLGKHSGRTSLRLALKEAGLDPASADPSVLERVHQHARHEKAALDVEDVVALERSRVS